MSNSDTDNTSNHNEDNTIPFQSASQPKQEPDNEHRYHEYMEPGSYQATPEAGYQAIPPSSYPPQANDLYHGRVVDQDAPRPQYGSVPREDTGNANQTYNHGYGYNNTPGTHGSYGTYPGSFGNVPPTGSNPPVKRGGLRAGALLLLTLVIVLVFGVGIFAGWQFGQNNTAGVLPAAQTSTLQAGSNSKVTIPSLSANNVETVREAVVAKTRPGVVLITVNSQNGTALGSGVIIDNRGYIVTNNHVVSGSQTVSTVTLADGTTVKNAPVVGIDPADDLALIKINPTANMTVVPVGNSSDLRVGQDVLAIGNPLGNTQTVTNGIVSALGRNVSEQNGATIPGAIQTDAPINPGNSGGALVDLQGNLVGVPTLTAVDPEFNSPANGVGFAIPSNRVKFIAQQLIATGKVEHTGRAAIGISPTSVDAAMQAQAGLAVDHGVLITQLVAGGAAEKAGIKAGDVIVQIDNANIDAISNLQDALISKNPGDKVTVKIYRGNQQMTFSVTLGELQSGS
ncbi:S1C family serine protease [Dictyobacter arantiisoli]|uniref:Peptidase n=1 Tax=Dictyobacter arantiisoli TaxID=2014874 RepID=A0A5A5THR2_9CHLR|nr:trypsin-like peptidase domain-containing protein [Dictyobacter arantiisoli]GCF10504.1 peptidase [Dictyobacter arantiisoli]